MKVLGIANATDSGACVLVDGHLVAAANEERFTREKLTRELPLQSLQYVLATTGTTLDEFDVIACGCWRGIDQAWTLPRLMADVEEQIDTQGPAAWPIIQSRIAASSRSDVAARDRLMRFLESLGVPQYRVSFVDHHYAHAVTAYLPSPFDDAVVLIADGRGDFRSVSLWKATRRDGLEFVDGATELASPGALYGSITKILGFVPDRHEGKVTGLAAYGDMTDAYETMRRGFAYDETAGRIRSWISDSYSPFVGADLKSLQQRLQHFRREDVAFAVQRLLEDSLKGFLMQHIRQMPEDSVDLCLAGGCMSNVKLNQVLAELAPVRDVYVFPSMGDGGSAAGGALGIAAQRGSLSKLDMPHVFLGPSYHSAEIEAALRQHSAEYRFVGGSKSAVAAALLAAGRIVGWFQGRMEFGPRALGARSILAPATDRRMTQVLNARLQRTDFMPFAPATIPDIADRCFENWHRRHRAAEFMTMCYRCTGFFAERCPAAVHVDNTARPQIVHRETNPDFYDLIELYIHLTGIPAILNTSFNHHEEPIVCTPADAVRGLCADNVDVLVIGDFVASVKSLDEIMKPCASHMARGSSELQRLLP